MRDRVSERERLQIESYYYLDVTGQLDKAAQAFHEWVENYPRDYVAYGSLAIAYAEQGQHENALKANREFLGLAPDNVAGYANLGNTLLALNRFDEARKTLDEAIARKLEDPNIYINLYATALLTGDTGGMAKESSALESRPEYATLGLSLEADTAAYGGQLHKARTITERAVSAAMQTDSKENAATWLANAALREATFGNLAEARRAALQAIKLAPTTKGVELEASLAFAMTGDRAKAQSLTQDLTKRFPLDTHVQSFWLPTIEAQLQLNQHDPSAAIDSLQAAAPIELAMIPFTQNLSCMYPTYLRGEAYLALGRGSEAGGEFQKILDHSGIVWNCQTGALAWLGLARARALQAQSEGSDTSARASASHAYQDFLAKWKDAAADIPVLKQAQAESAKWVESH